MKNATNGSMAKRHRKMPHLHDQLFDIQEAKPNPRRIKIKSAPRSIIRIQQNTTRYFKSNKGGGSKYSMKK